MKNRIENVLTTEKKNREETQEGILEMIKIMFKNKEIKRQILPSIATTLLWLILLLSSDNKLTNIVLKLLI